MLVNGTLLHRFEEAEGAAARLGRHLELDGRSLAYTIEGKAEALRKPVKPSEHPANITTLDQGHLGSCTGNAGTYALSALLGNTGMVGVSFEGHALTNFDAKANEQFAVAVYHEATVQDGFPGTYPPDDTGSSGLGVARALKGAGLIGGYVWATTYHGLGVLLQGQGVMIGTPWYEAWFQPDAHGFVDVVGWSKSAVAGGHEIYVEALEAWDDRDPAKSVIRFHNSWGDGWGDHGCGRMRLSTYIALKSQIDVKQLSPK